MDEPIVEDGEVWVRPVWTRQVDPIWGAEDAYRPPTRVARLNVQLGADSDPCWRSRRRQTAGKGTAV